MKLILHNNILQIHKISKKLGLNVKKDAIEIVSSLLNIGKGKYPDCCQILIPAFDYKPFSTNRINTTENWTRFGFASVILSGKDQSAIDIVYDPVFSFIQYPGTGKIIGNKKTTFKPFNDPQAFLNDRDVIAFTKDAFEPTHLIEIENILFGQHHPYRYNKEFEFTDFDRRQIQFNYMVRPKDDKLSEYDLGKIYGELVSTGALETEKETGMKYVRYKDLVDYVFSICKRNELGLLSIESQRLVRSIMQDGKIPAQYFI